MIAPYIVLFSICLMCFGLGFSTGLLVARRSFKKQIDEFIDFINQYTKKNNSNSN